MVSIEDLRDLFGEDRLELALALAALAAKQGLKVDADAAVLGAGALLLSTKVNCCVRGANLEAFIGKLKAALGITGVITHFRSLLPLVLENADVEWKSMFGSDPT